MRHALISICFIPPLVAGASMCDARRSKRRKNTPLNPTFHADINHQISVVRQVSGQQSTRNDRVCGLLPW